VAFPHVAEEGHVGFVFGAADRDGRADDHFLAFPRGCEGRAIAAKDAGQAAS